MGGRVARPAGAPRPVLGTDPTAENWDDTATLPDSWMWVGLVYLDQGELHSVVLADSLGECWEALLDYPGRPTRLCVPVRPVGRDA